MLKEDNLPNQCLAYDTTYDMGDFYVSIITFRQTEFVSSPVTPLIFLIHERKWEWLHQFLFWRLLQLVPELNSKKVVERTIIVTDEETAIVNAVKKYLPNMPRFRCWIHAWKNIKKKLRDLGISKKENLKEYKGDFIKLLTRDCYQSYNDCLLSMIIKWDNKVKYN